MNTTTVPSYYPLRSEDQRNRFYGIANQQIAEYGLEDTVHAYQLGGFQRGILYVTIPSAVVILVVTVSSIYFAPVRAAAMFVLFGFGILLLAISAVFLVRVHRQREKAIDAYDKCLEAILEYAEEMDYQESVWAASFLPESQQTQSSANS